MANPLKTPEWQGKSITHPDHAHDLERRAAVLEMAYRLPKEQAEAHAYHEYKKDQRTAAAAHHLNGMRAASAAGDSEEARKHSVLYSMHVQALGHDPAGAVPPEVASLAGQPDSKHYRFKSHRADSLLLQD